MNILSVESFYRFPSDRKAYVEDGISINQQAKVFAVFDGISGPYSPSNPGLRYEEGQLSGGQMVAYQIGACLSVALPKDDIATALLWANPSVLSEHKEQGKNPCIEAVAGASLAACKVCDDRINLVVVGDSFALYKDSEGFHYITNFDEAAFEKEDTYNKVFAKCLERAKGNKGLAWDLYYPYFCEKQLYRANKNIGNGGHAVLNGDLALEECWTKKAIADSSGLEWIILGTDGLIPSSFKDRSSITQRMGKIYEKGGVSALLAWRDKTDFLPHIGLGNWPEASLIELIYS